MMDKVILINANLDIIVCTEKEAEGIQAKQYVDIFNNGFTSQLDHAAE